MVEYQAEVILCEGFWQMMFLPLKKTKRLENI